MPILPAVYDPAAIEASTRALWSTRGLPPSPGTVGPVGGAIVRQLFGPIGETEAPLDRLVRFVSADVEARYLAMTGRRAVGLVPERPRVAAPTLDFARAAIEAVAAWTADGVPIGFSTPEGAAQRQRMLESLAKSGILAARGFPFRSCPQCETPRTPETIVYQSERGPAYLVRFPIRDSSQPTSLLVWTDNPWKLLGTSAVLVSPDLPYVTAVYRRRGGVERIVLARSAIPRLKEWLPGCEVEVLEERPGGELSGTAYVHPLLTECPPLANLTPPAGTVLASSEVGDSGTGIVGLVPRHGAADSQAAAALRVDGPLVVTPGGIVRPEPRHKYTGLPLEAADAFVLRDLKESGLIFAELTVRRGVPHCSICGSSLIWLPGRAWCVEMARLPAPIEREFARLLPDDSLPPARDVVPWPVSETVESHEASAPVLLECDSCDRLHAPSFDERCPCGATALHPVRRDLLPAISGALAVWAEVGASESAQLFVPDRRRVPTLLHHLIAREAAGVRPGDLKLVRLPTMATDSDAELLSAGGCADALRASLIRATNPSLRPSHLSDRFRHESRRLRKLWQLARHVLETMESDGVHVEIAYSIEHLTELPDEDRALLSRFERVRNEVRVLFEALDFQGALDRLSRFMEQDVGTGYLPLARTRLLPSSSPSVRAATCQVLARVVYLWVEQYAPIAPFTSEAIAQAFRPDSPSLFERRLTAIGDVLVDAEREKEFDRWVEFAGALRSARRQVGLPADSILPRVVLLVGDDALAAELQQVAPVLARVGRTGQIEIDSPNHAWSGRRIEARPVPAEIQRVYGSRTGRILHLLERFSGRKAMEGMRNGSLNVVLDGQTVKILPGMLEFMESLPECVIPVPWRDGEILLVDPTESAHGSLPSLSLDGLAVIRHIRQRLRRAGLQAPPERILAAATGALAIELGHHAAALATHLRCGRFELVADDIRFPLAERSTGRTRRGDRWAVWIPGVALGAHRLKNPKARPRGARVRRIAPKEPDAELELDEAGLKRYDSILELSDQLAADVGRPLLGPAKMAAAWDAGFRTVDEFRSAPFEKIAELPGFGYFVAAEIVHQYGGTVPERAPRAPPIRSVPKTPSPVVAIPPPLPVPAPEPAPVARRAVPPPPIPVTEVPAAPPSPPPVRVTRIPPRVQPPKVQMIPSTRGFAAPVLTPITPPPPPGVPVSILPGPAATPAPSMVVPTIAPSPERREPPTPSPFEPRPVPLAPPPPPQPTGVEVWRGSDAEGAWSSFLDLTLGGGRGVCITREPPGARRAALGSRVVQVVWLSNIPLGPANPTARPGDLDGIEFGIRSELNDHDAKAIFLESLEYLVTIHGIARITAFLSKIDEIARDRGARIFVPLRTGLMDPNDLQTIAGNFHGPTDAPIQGSSS
ncbi:MAG: class I tRNA ligase family protein [Thermoplasmata archaeon]|nr:class I tRNA ligase family protein [Thermoplasmata archaeon]MCI4359465.1 class I tRNA ligase family protein [Thermoplasmata archaeon]